MAPKTSMETERLGILNIRLNTTLEQILIRVQCGRRFDWLIIECLEKILKIRWKVEIRK